MNISIQGRLGSFHHIAAQNILTEPFDILSRDSFREIFEDLASDRAQMGIVAIENSIAGSLSYNFDLLSEFRFPIIGEVFLRISHHLMALPDQSMEDVREVWSHPMAIEQCRVFLRKYPHIHILEQEDTAGSAERIATLQKKGIGAIASKLAAERYGLAILAENIETDPNNYTRFLVLSKEKEALEDQRNYRDYKTTLYAGISHTSGSLVDFLITLRNHNINMSKIESRPRMGEPWHYDFYLDIVGSVTPETHPDLFQELREKSTFLHILGSYPIIYSEFHT